MSDNNGGRLALLVILYIVYWLAQAATYIMAVVRWFSTDHNTFWYGFKELVWALVPVVNFTYVWDLWVGAFLFVLALFHR